MFKPGTCIYYTLSLPTELSLRELIIVTLINNDFLLSIVFFNIQVLTTLQPIDLTNLYLGVVATSFL